MYSSISNSVVPAGTVAVIGTVTTVPPCPVPTSVVLEPIKVRVPAGKGPPVFVYKLTDKDGGEE